METLGSTMDINAWPSTLGITKSGYWAQFDGNQTKKPFGKCGTLTEYVEKRPKNV